MARNGTDFLTKRNSKLESFLKLNLPQHVYEQIRGYEPCVVNFRKEKRAFKYAILTSQRIYLTDNPPKTIRDEDSVFLGDLVGVQLVNDIPEFFTGEERETAQHILVKYQNTSTQTKKKNELQRGNSKEKEEVEEGSIPDFLVTEPNGNIRDVEISSENGNPSPTRKINMKLHSSLNESDMRALRELNLDTSGSEEDKLSLSCPSSELSDLSRNSSISSLESPSGSQFGGSRVIAIDTLRPLPTNSNHSETSSISEVASRNGSFKGPYRRLPSPDITDLDRRKEPFQFPTLKENNNVPSHPSLMRRLSLDSSGVLSKDKQKILKANKRENKKMELHIYVIAPSSPFLMHLRSSWTNFHIRSTIMRDAEAASRLRLGSGPSAKHPSSKQLEHQFSQLKQEIMNSADSMESLFSLVQELCNAAEKYFVLKKFFWKHEDLLLFFLTLLKKYLPKSSADLLTENGRHQRADELEIAILLMETLGLLFHDTEIVPTRLSILKANSCKAAVDLLVILTCLPEIPQRWRPPKSKAHSLLLETDADNWESFADAEVSKLIQELTNTSTIMLYELILVAHQAGWGKDEDKSFTVPWVIRVLNSMQTTTFKYVERLLAQAMKLLMPSRHETLSPPQAVLLYQQFYVLQTLLVHSAHVTAHVRSNYNEEFRYYVQSPHIINKLPSDFPITKPTLRLIDDVLKHVLQVSSSLLQLGK